MKIAFIGRKGAYAKNEEAQKNAEEIAKRLAVKGHKVFMCAGNAAILRSLFQDYDVMHFYSAWPAFLIFIFKILKPRTAIISTSISAGTEIKNIKFSEYLQKWNLQKGGYAIYSGRLIRRKGVHFLIEAFKNLEDKHLAREKKLVIIGDGSRSSEYMKEIKDISRGRENIIFTGFQNGKALDQLFSNAYLFVHPSQSKAVSVSLINAMGFGKAILASDIKENLELLGGRAALFFRAGNVIDLEEKLVFFINNPALAKEMGEEARKRAQLEFSWDAITEKLESCYREALIRKRKINFNTQINARNI